MKRKLGLAALTCLELAPPDLVSAAAAAGYDCVGLRLVPVAGQVLPDFDERETARRLADTGVRVLDVEVFRLDPLTDVAAFEPVLASAARLGASEVLVHGADPDAARLAQALGRLCELCARYGLNANLEPMPWVDVSTVSQANAVIEAAGRPNAAVLVDAIHFFRAPNRFADIPARLNYMQLCDAHAGTPADAREVMRQARSDRLFPGEGALDLQGLMRALPADLPASIEVPVARPMEPLERAKRALSVTQAFLARLQAGPSGPA